MATGGARRGRQFLTQGARWLSSLEIGPKAPVKSARGKNLFELAALLPNGGVGTRFVRKSWLRNGYEDSHWTIARIRFEPVRGSRIELLSTALSRDARL